jgi:cytochrome oxidase Cu insertion factor (SCO1/SenC/PrrC family)
MGKHEGKLEPAVRDEKKLRKTAWSLVAFAVLGGVMIFWAYERYALNMNKDGRPSYSGELRHNLPVLRQDGKRVALDELQGKVWILHAASATQPETGALPMSVMKSLAKKYAGRSDVVLLSFVIDPGAPEQAAAVLRAAAEKQGATLPQWWFVTTEPSVLHKYLKDKCKLGSLPHQENGEWKYDGSLVLVDRNLKLRKAVVPQQRGGPPFVTGFDFDQAAGWDERDVKTGTERNNVQELQFLLENTIDTLLHEVVNEKKS